MDKSLYLAYKGRSASRGGLNVKEFRESLVEQFPKKEKKIRACKNRKQLIECCEKDRNIRASMNRMEKNYSPRNKYRSNGRRSPPRSPPRRKINKVYRSRSPRKPEEEGCGCGLAKSPRKPEEEGCGCGLARSPRKPEEEGCGCGLVRSPSYPEGYFKKGTSLTDKQKRYCRCIAHVASNYPMKCYSGSDPEWKKGPKSKKCGNPYSICASSVGTTTSCYDHYDFRRMPKKEVKALKALHGK